MASLAGSVLAVHWGFAGMTWRDGVLGFRPVLPRHWTSVTFRLLWRGRLIELEIGLAKVTYTLLQGLPVEVHHFGAPFLLNGVVELERPAQLDRIL
jgi:alpha,alpha-trehalose phosphorylase